MKSKVRHSGATRRVAGLAIGALLLAASVPAHSNQPSTASPAQLPKMTVEAAKKGNYANNPASPGTKTDTPALETPLNIQVVMTCSPI